MKCPPAICAVYVTAFLLCNLDKNKKVSEKVVFSGLLNAYQLEGYFPRAPWQLNDRPKVIWLCDDMSEATLRWDSGAGTISGETAEACIYILWLFLLFLCHHHQGNGGSYLHHYPLILLLSEKRVVIAFHLLDGKNHENSQWFYFNNYIILKTTRTTLFISPLLTP